MQQATTGRYSFLTKHFLTLYCPGTPNRHTPNFETTCPLHKVLGALIQSGSVDVTHTLSFLQPTFDANNLLQMCQKLSSRKQATLNLSMRFVLYYLLPALMSSFN